MQKLTADRLLGAYAAGIFPMAQHREDTHIRWVRPVMRGVLPLDRIHLSRSLKKTIRKGVFTVTCDQAFERIIALCAEPAPDRPDTWINDQILSLFIELHEKGLAHSVEVWKDGALAGGLYGLALGGAFFGESMVSRADNASKVALAYLAGILKKGGFSLLDVQFITDHLASLGVVEIPDALYRNLLRQALEKDAAFSCPKGFDPLAILFPAVAP